MKIENGLGTKTVIGEMYEMKKSYTNMKITQSTQILKFFIETLSLILTDYFIITALEKCVGLKSIIL